VNPPQPRLLPDFAAAPTDTERNHARRYWHAQQTDMFADADRDTPPPACPVCAGPHSHDHCPHGTAPDLFGDDPR
jgi:hypothetical protein